MKYAHLADLHLGSWRDQKMRDLSIKSFLTAMDLCLQQQVDFILFAGDLFNTSIPSLDTLKIITKKLKEIADQNIPIYTIAGSHDYSPSGKTMLDVLENAGIIVNVCKGQIHPETKELHLNLTTDKKTGAKITGIIGRRGLLDKTYYQNLYRKNIEQEKGYKIFMFHTTLSELKPAHLEKIDSQPLSFLPKCFNYYAGGHVHHPSFLEEPEYGTITYPGALFPNNFAELEKYGKGGYYLIEVGENIVKENTLENNNNNNAFKKPLQKITWIPLEIIKHHSLILDCSHLSEEIIATKIIDYFKEKDLMDSLITIRLKGTLENGKVSGIDFKQIFNYLYEQGASFIMKNTAQLNSKEFAEIKISCSNPENIEEEIIKEHLQQQKLFKIETELYLTKELLTHLNISRKEGETIASFQEKIKTGISKLLDL